MDPRTENADFSQWYPLFKSLTPKTRILEAPESFRKYLLSDGICLVDDEPTDEEDLELVKPPTDFHNLITSTINDLNGEVAPKLNWSAPVDATWMLTSNTMRCTTANDVYMLLKSSDYINHDLLQNPPKLVLVLREWFDVHPATEFRCFYKHDKVIGITQRDMNYYDFLEPQIDSIEQRSTILGHKLSEKYPDKEFVFDVHLPSSNDKAWLIDINPWLDTTNTMLFSWDELNAANEPLGVRLVDKVDRSRTFNSKPHSTSQVPLEFIDMERNSFEELISQMKEQRSKETN